MLQKTKKKQKTKNKKTEKPKKKQTEKPKNQKNRKPKKQQTEKKHALKHKLSEFCFPIFWLLAAGIRYF